jgi:hypothetical protein
MAMPTPADAAARWAQQLGGAAQRYTDGVNAVKVAPGTLAARAADTWANNTIAAKARFTANSQKVTLSDWQAAASGKGAARLASGAQAAQPKMEAALVRVFAQINQVVGSLPPRGDIEANIARAAAFARGMNKLKLQG